MYHIIAAVKSLHLHFTGIVSGGSMQSELQ